MVMIVSNRQSPSVYQHIVEEELVFRHGGPAITAGVDIVPGRRRDEGELVGRDPYYTAICIVRPLNRTMASASKLMHTQQNVKAC